MKQSSTEPMTTFTCTARDARLKKTNSELTTVEIRAPLQHGVTATSQLNAVGYEYFP